MTDAPASDTATGDGRAEEWRLPLLYNPAAAGGRGAVRLREAEALLAVRGIPVRPVPTERPGHATRLVRDLVAAGERRILVLGGDGTLSEAAQGALGLGDRAREVTFGFLPGGTGNDFLRDFGVTDLEAAAERIVAGRVRSFDAAHVSFGEGDAAGERYSINVFATGFGARVADRTNRRFKFLGKAGYTAAVLAELAALRADRTRLVLDGVEVHGVYPMVAVCNSRHTGGGMALAPDADPTDGELDWFTLGDLGRLAFLRVFPRVFKGTHKGHPQVGMGRARVVRIEPERPSPLLIDGEVIGSTPAEVRVLPGALRAYL